MAQYTKKMRIHAHNEGEVLFMMLYKEGGIPPFFVRFISKNGKVFSIWCIYDAHERSTYDHAIGRK